MRPGDVYAEMEVSTEVLTASPHRQIQMLLDKCLQHLNQIKMDIVAGDMVHKCQTIGKAMDIVDYLRIALNHENGETQKLAAQLDQLYEYVNRKLIIVNMMNDTMLLRQLIQIINSVKAGWDGVAK